MVQASSRSVLVVDDLSSKRAVPGKLKFESNHVTVTTLRYFTMELLIDLYLKQSFSDSSSDGRKTFNVQFRLRYTMLPVCPPVENEKQLCNIHIKRLNGKKSYKKGGWLWRPSAYIISSNITTASVPAKLNIVNQGSAASIDRIARLGYPDEEVGSQDRASTWHTLATGLSAHVSRG